MYVVVKKLTPVTEGNRTTIPLSPCRPGALSTALCIPGTDKTFTVTPVERIIADPVVQVVVLIIVKLLLSVPAHWASHLAYTMSQAR
jgi:hypothetical protein